MNWLKPTNPKEYDHRRAFNELKVVTWSSSVKNINIGDIVYIYSSAPDKKITHRCIVEKVNVNSKELIPDDCYLVGNKFDNSYKDNKSYINLRLIEEIDNSDLGYDKLIKNGLTTVQSMSKISDQLIDYIFKVSSNIVGNKEYQEELFNEGHKDRVVVNRYERSKDAREACINYYGEYICQICGFDFEKEYGELGKNFIEVHHKELISKNENKSLINPIKDLIPVCPNCHAMLHRTLNGKPMDVDLLRSIIKNK